MDAITRKEKIISGENIEPLTREEYFLKEYGGGSGGTTVVANPSGTAGADLTKLQVGNDIYGIPSGGGGDEKFVINVTMDGESFDVEADKTYAEVVAAYAAGKQLFVNFSTNSAYVPMRIRICSNIPLSHVYGSDNSDFVFSYSNIGDGYVDFGEILFQNLSSGGGNVVYHFETVYIGG